MKKIYLDYAATTPVKANVLEKMMPFFTDKFANPSSIHSFGEEAVFALDDSRKAVAQFLNSHQREVVFTASATEANNMAVLGASNNGHIITSSFEHEAVLGPCKTHTDVTYLPVYKEGVVKVEDVLKEIKENTTLISIMYVNSEIGTIQPIKEIGEALEEVNKNRKNKILFHTDAVQAANYLSCDVNNLKVDLLTLSGHKIYGPKGVGVLYVREGSKISQILYGAHQERGHRPGTENIPAIVGMGEAIRSIDVNDSKKTKTMRDKVIDGITSSISGAALNGSRENRIANNINITFTGVEGESMLIALNEEGIAVSTGSACASNSLSPSHVLLSLGLSHRAAHGSLRITLGSMTTEKEIDELLTKLPPIVERLREISGR